MLPLRRASPKTFEELRTENPFATHDLFLSHEQVDDFEKIIEANSGETATDNFM